MYGILTYLPSMYCKYTSPMDPIGTTIMYPDPNLPARPMRPCWMALTPPNGCICSIPLSPIRHKTRLKGWPRGGSQQLAGYEFIGVTSWELTDIPSQPPLSGRWFSLFNGLVLESNGWFFFPPIFGVQMKDVWNRAPTKFYGSSWKFRLRLGGSVFRMIHDPRIPVRGRVWSSFGWSIHPWKLTAGAQSHGGGWKMIVLFNWVTFRFKIFIFKGKLLPETNSSPWKNDTPQQTNMSLKNQWVVQTYFLLNYSPFFRAPNSLLFRGSIPWDPTIKRKPSHVHFQRVRDVLQRLPHITNITAIAVSMHQKHLGWFFLLFLLNHPLTHFCWGQKSFWRSVFGICLLLVWGDTPSHMLHGTGIFTNKFTINFMPCMSRWAHLGFIFGLHVRGKRVGPKNEHPDPPNDTDSQEVNNTLQEINISPW